MVMESEMFFPAIAQQNVDSYKVQWIIWIVIGHSFNEQEPITWRETSYIDAFNS